MEHTKGKLEIDFSSQCCCEIKANDTLIFQTPTDPQWNGYSPEEAQANAEHLVKCWNCHEPLLKACEMGLKLAQMLNHPDEHHIKAAIAATDQEQSDKEKKQ